MMCEKGMGKRCGEGEVMLEGGEGRGGDEIMVLIEWRLVDEMVEVVEVDMIVDMGDGTGCLLGVEGVNGKGDING
ncbi:hypothetical protein, partial [Paenibacillus xylanexedens]|uniref:hypothetical protein n=1 Tax=Paenibacillus xylanexedens TaxID=528191 RepID=UPI00119E4F40